ncbi:MAG TPA: glycosyl hydrolase-related protein [Vicinamibacterales bacterium]|jgi:mannosylglycerate hydrolase|nr:glycosyl hydrolase-related protein [Vicinamibacterales bacterium]
MTTTVHVISHTHWDREWYRTFEQYRARLVDLVDAVLDRMERDPRFTFFHLDGQSIVLEDYLEIRPEREDEIRQRVQEGRLLVGPWFVMPDMFLVSGESLVRNLARGIRIAETFGRAMRVGYIPDPFGHVGQMPQILAGMGLEGAILWRGFGGRRAEYKWRAPDGTDVLLSHLPPDGYCNGLRLPLVSGDELLRQASAVLAYEKQRSSSQQILLMVGVDHVEPHPRLMDVVDVINTMPGITAGISTLPDFVRSVRQDVDISALPTVDGELRSGQDYAHLLPGVFSARTYLKKANALAQRELEQWAEPLSVMAAIDGAPTAHGTIAYAWRTLLQNHPHDSICGCSIDAVHDENMTRFAKVHQVIEGAAERSIRWLTSGVPAVSSGTLRTIALNTAASRWEGVFIADVDLPLEPARGFPSVDFTVLDDPAPCFGADAVVTDITDAAGKRVPFQILHAIDTIDFRMSRFAPPPGLRVRRMRLAIEASVPPMGYTVLDLHVGHARRDSGASPGEHGAAVPVLENDLVRVSYSNGAATIVDIRTGVSYSTVFLLEDSGDVGDEYNYAPPAADEHVTSAVARDVQTRTLDDGPLTSALEIEYTLDVPEAAAPDRRRRSATRAALHCVLQMRIRKASPAVVCHLRVTNTARDHRLRIRCATGAARVTHHRADGAFDLVSREAMPAGSELSTSNGLSLRKDLTEIPSATAPMQSFVDAGDENCGAVIIADGLPEFELVSGEEGAAVAVTLLRCVGDLSRNDLSTRRGHAGPGLATPGAQCAGTHEFSVTFVPRSCPPDAAALYSLARAALMPPRLTVATAGDGRIPAHASLLSVESRGGAIPVLSACKLADDRRSAIVRLFNPSDESARAALVLAPSIAQAFRTDLLEQRTGACEITDGRLFLDIGPRRIETVELVIGSPNA